MHNAKCKNRDLRTGAARNGNQGGGQDPDGADGGKGCPGAGNCEGGGAGPDFARPDAA